MKKLFAMMLSAAMMLSLASCGSKTEEPAPAPAPAPAPEASQPAPEAPAEGLERVTLFDAAETELGCYAWFDPSVMEAEKIHYMVARLMTEGG